MNSTEGFTSRLYDRRKRKITRSVVEKIPSTPSVKNNDGAPPILGVE
jgi:hypothetical protein